jgi:hypothetical protein
MADAGIKKVIISKKNLPSIFGTDQKYVVRYRIVSEDRNRTSHWSAQYKLAIYQVMTYMSSGTLDHGHTLILLQQITILV